VPIAEIEAYAIADLVEGLPEPRRSQVRERFDEAFAHFAGIGWFERLSEAAEKPQSEQQELVLEYFREGIPCPFLVDESCSIHADRPVACREYLVTSPAENCAAPSAEGIAMVKLLTKPSKTLMKIGQVRQIRGVNFIPLVMALRWAEGNEDKFAEKTGEQWMADFFGHVIGPEEPEPPSGG
jgi:Fe-S-cluster containining protein